MSVTLITPAALNVAVGLTKGDYQRSLLFGHSSWSGSDLCGKAARYFGRYSESRENLLIACRKAGLRAVVSPIGERGRKVATILTKAEARGIPAQPILGGDVSVEGRAMEARIERIAKRAAAAKRKRARETAMDEATLATLAV